MVLLALSKELYNVPIPSSISYMWNMGSLLGCCLVIQIVSGLFLAMHYQASIFLSFDSIVKIMNDVNGGWVIRFLHANTASAFFICIYLHVGRGLYYGSYRLTMPWIVGTLIILVIMATAFLGYVLPWGQMSYWGATVITNLLSALPYIGKPLVEWVWGGFSVSDPTLIRMFSVHFILPFLALVLVLLHLVSLHLTGSSNPLGLGSDSDKVSFHPYFFIKDLVGVIMFMFIMMVVVFQVPSVFMDPDNFMPANPMNTPPHIQPEWYFLFAYAILRSIPSKLGGVVALVMSILILLWLPLSQLPAGSFIVKYLTAVQVMIFLTLTWLGAVPAEAPYVGTSQVCAFMYFSVFILWMTR